MGVCYRSPKHNWEEVEMFLEQFHSSLSDVIALRSESVILCGDFNDKYIKWDSVHSELGNKLYDLKGDGQIPALEEGVQQLVTCVYNVYILWRAPK